MLLIAFGVHPIQADRYHVMDDDSLNDVKKLFGTLVRLLDYFKSHDLTLYGYVCCIQGHFIIRKLYSWQLCLAHGC